MKSAYANIPGLGQFLADYPLMMFRPRVGRAHVLRGRFAFTAAHREAGEVNDEFDLEIEIPPSFPREVPLVTEIGGRIPKEADSHVNSADGTLCLGSPLRLLRLLAEQPSMIGFADKCLVPYLFAQSQRLSGGGNFAFGELAHGLPGMLDDYVVMFGLKDIRQAVETLRLLGMKKRLANKQLCPCGCRKKLGQCRFNTKVREFRAIASRSWFRIEREAILKVANLVAERATKAKAAAKRDLPTPSASREVAPA